MALESQLMPDEISERYKQSRFQCLHVGTIVTDHRVLQALEVMDWCGSSNCYSSVVWRYDFLGEIPYLLFWYQDIESIKQWFDRCQGVDPCAWDAVLRNQTSPGRVEERYCAKDLPFFLEVETENDPLSSVA
jgi:hypothetical protein